ncbi:MAG: hypothetical protein U0Q11_15260 [Vicinamibacterales bacterium]
MVKASETGALGAGSSSPEIRANKPPVVKVDGAKTLTAKVGQPVSVAVVVTDDGVPKFRGAGLAGAAVSNRGTRSDRHRKHRCGTRANRAMQPPARATVGKNVGLHVSWFVYRAPPDAPATFDPQIKPWEDTRAGANSPWAPIWGAANLAGRLEDLGQGHLLAARHFLHPPRARRRRRADRERRRDGYRD